MREIEAAEGHGSDAGRRPEPLFRGPAGDRVLTFTHLPPGPAVGGVVICSPIGSERVRNHGRELTLSSALAQRGVVVERLHYRYSGDSDGESENLGFASMTADVVRAARRLADERRVERIAMVGTRLGGMVAAAAASELRPVALALWEPVVSPATYFDEIFRYKLIQDVLQSRFQGGASSRPLREELRARGFTDLLGFPLTRKLYEESGGHRLESDLIDSSIPLMVAQIRAESALCSEYSGLVGRLVERGFEVETAVFPERVAWWFLARVYLDSSLDGEIVDFTASWLVGQLSGA